MTDLDVVTEILTTKLFEMRFRSGFIFHQQMIIILHDNQQMKIYKQQKLKTCQGPVTLQTIEQLQQPELSTLNKIRKNHGCPPLFQSPLLTSLAQKYAEDLYTANKFEHSDTQYGQNLYRASFYWNQRYKKARAVEAWHQEIKNYDFQTGKSKNGEMVGHFTSQIWREVKEVGFGFYWGVSHTDPKFMVDFYVVALFNPAPNIPGKYTQNVPRPLPLTKNR